MSALRRVSRQGGNKPVILHVEDDPDIRQVLASLVGNEAELVAAPSLAGAKAKLAADRFDLIILDLGLPDGSGLDLLPLLNERGLAVPVMIFSAGESSLEVSRQVAAALVKARTSNEVLLATIKQLIGRA
jgi:DNA-binding response OmpR family regulator